jgi:DNA-binding Xre family transcriptional regulator
MMNGIQFLTDATGKRTSAVIPIELFEKLVAESELDEFFEPVPYEAGDNDDETLPGDVINILHKQDVPLHVAWRLYRGMSQDDVAAALGITQAGVSKMESRTKPQKATLEKLAKLYDCRVTQLYM